jgi:hypothetical protein
MSSSNPNRATDSRLGPVIIAVGLGLLSFVLCWRILSAAKTIAPVVGDAPPANTAVV